MLGLRILWDNLHCQLIFTFAVVIGLLMVVIEEEKDEEPSTCGFSVHQRARKET